MLLCPPLFCTLIRIRFLPISAFAQCMCPPPTSNQLSYVLNVPPGYQQTRNVCCFPAAAVQRQQQTAQQQNQVLVYYGNKAPWTLPNGQQQPGQGQQGQQVQNPQQPLRDANGNIIKTIAAAAPNSGSGFPQQQSTNNPAISVYPVVGSAATANYQQPTTTPYPTGFSQTPQGYSPGPGQQQSTTPFPPQQGQGQDQTNTLLYTNTIVSSNGGSGPVYLQPGQPGQFTSQPPLAFTVSPQPGQQFTSPGQQGFQGSTVVPYGFGYNGPNSGFTTGPQPGQIYTSQQTVTGGPGQRPNQQGAPYNGPQGQQGFSASPQGEQYTLLPYNQGPSQGYTGQPTQPGQFGGQNEGFPQGFTEGPGYIPPGQSSTQGPQGITSTPQQQGFSQGFTQSPGYQQGQGYTGQPQQQGFTGAPNQQQQYSTQGYPGAAGPVAGPYASGNPITPGSTELPYGESSMTASGQAGQMPNGQGNFGSQPTQSGQAGVSGYNFPNTQYQGTTPNDFNFAQTTGQPGQQGDAIPPYYESQPPQQGQQGLSSTQSPYGGASSTGYPMSSTGFPQDGQQTSQSQGAGFPNNGGSSTPFPQGAGQTYGPNQGEQQPQFEGNGPTGTPQSGNYGQFTTPGPYGGPSSTMYPQFYSSSPAINIPASSDDSLANTTYESPTASSPTVNTVTYNPEEADAPTNVLRDPTVPPTPSPSTGATSTQAQTQLSNASWSLWAFIVSLLCVTVL